MKRNKKNEKKSQQKNRKIKPIDRGELFNPKPNQRQRQIEHYKIEDSRNPSKKIKKKYVDSHHTPYKKIRRHKIHYPSPRIYHRTIQPKFIYKGLWIRISINHDNGYYFYNGYPYFIYHGYLHRYSSTDAGSYDLVDRYTNQVYATFYGNSLKQSYDRCAELRDRLNNRLGEFRYFCAERFQYDPDYSYGWNPHDYPNWYWH